MKVKKLIELLSNHMNDEVFIYDGFVDDFVDIENISKETLFKIKPKKLRELVERQNEQLNIDEDIPDKIVTKWELPSDFVDYEQNKDFYTTKDVLLISPKKKGETYFDRLGSIEY